VHGGHWAADRLAPKAETRRVRQARTPRRALGDASRFGGIVFMFTDVGVNFPRSPSNNEPATRHG